MAKQDRKEDQRVRLTKALLRDAFLQLLSQKPVQNVTVKELCELAGVNRGTFYLHYKDVYDLLHVLENELLQDLDALLGPGTVIAGELSAEAGAGFTQAIFAFFEKNRAMCAILLGENGDKKFLAGIIARARESTVESYQQMFPGTTWQKAETFYDFVAWGFIGLIQQSLRNPAISFKTVAADAGRIVAEASRFFSEN